MLKYDVKFQSSQVLCLSSYSSEASEQERPGWFLLALLLAIPSVFFYMGTLFVF